MSPIHEEILSDALQSVHHYTDSAQEELRFSAKQAEVARIIALGVAADAAGWHPAPGTDCAAPAAPPEGPQESAPAERGPKAAEHSTGLNTSGLSHLPAGVSVFPSAMLNEWKRAAQEYTRGPGERGQYLVKWILSLIDTDAPGAWVTFSNPAGIPKEWNSPKDAAASSASVVSTREIRMMFEEQHPQPDNGAAMIIGDFFAANQGKEGRAE